MHAFSRYASILACSRSAATGCQRLSATRWRCSPASLIFYGHDTAYVFPAVLHFICHCLFIACVPLVSISVLACSRPAAKGCRWLFDPRWRCSPTSLIFYATTQRTCFYCSRPFPISVVLFGEDLFWRAPSSRPRAVCGFSTFDGGTVPRRSFLLPRHSVHVSTVLALL